MLTGNRGFRKIFRKAALKQSLDKIDQYREEKAKSTNGREENLDGNYDAGSGTIFRLSKFVQRSKQNLSIYFLL
jgi:hypothetical protein